MRPETPWIAVAVWTGIVVLHGLWRSRGQAVPDPVREAGPLDQV